MPGYTKLFSSIVASTVWNEDNDTRIVWITLLALADKRGIVEGSVSGLAVLARVSVDGCRAAITKLSNPDPDSRNKTQGGRRIEAIDGGWRIVNHGTYRQKLSEDDRREYQRHWMADKRAKAPAVDSVDSMLTNVDSVYTSRSRVQSTDADPEADIKKTPSLRSGGAGGATSLDNGFEAFWKVYPKKVGKGAARAAWMKLKPSGDVVQAVERQKRSKQWMRDSGRFIPNPATWLNQRRWDDEPDPDVPYLSDRTIKLLGNDDTF